VSVLAAAEALRDATRAFEPAGRVAFAYHPLDYAWDVHRAFAARYGRGKKRALILGMNPGPWGMAQTGVPFGDAARVKGWLGLDGEVRAPARAHPKRPVLGLACPRRDISGERFYAWAEARFGSAKAFFARCYVANHCPVLFLDAQGRNLTPAQLPRRELRALHDAGDAHLRALLDALRPERVVAVGRWAEARARRVVGDEGKVEVVGVIHPSPASPATNAGWAHHMDAAFPPGF
jgi:single-strand selective monofunctional uracil DNA glycosylase